MCGNIKAIQIGNLNNGISTNCGCKLDINLLGKRFGKLVVVELLEKRYYGSKYWRCHCDCGGERHATFGELKKWVKHCGCEKEKLPNGEVAFRALFAQYKIGAKNRKYLFNLSVEDFKKLTKQDCYYCGLSPKQIKRSKGSSSTYDYNGIDRKDNSVGYTKDNCITCCKTCNYAKYGQSIDEFRKWLSRAYNHFILKRS